MESPITSIMLEKLRNNLSGDLFFDNLHKQLFATDASVYRILPEAVAFPKNTDDIKQLVSFANTNSIGLIPRAAGTSLAGQCVGKGIIVDVSKYLTKIISLDTIKKTVTVEPGVIRDELNEYLKPHGLFFGPNTSTSNRCMIGGMVGNNSSGTTSIKYGVTRDKVIALKTILSNGEETVFSEISSTQFKEKAEEKTFEGSIYRTLLDTLSTESIQQEIKNEFPKPEIHRRNTGYALDSLIETETFSSNEKKTNIASLLCGSEGTLAFTTEITLQLDTIPPEHSAMLVGHYNSVTRCLLDVSEALKHDLDTCEMLDDTILNCTRQNKKYDSYRYFIKGEPKALLFFEIRDNSGEKVLERVNQLKIDLQKTQNSYTTVLLEKEAITKAMELRKAGLGLLGNMVGDKKAVACIEDTAVAIEDLPEFINEFSALMKQNNQDAVYYAHAGAGELHLRPILNLKKEADVVFFKSITTQVAQLVKKYKGSFSGEHGDGIVRGAFLPLLIGEKNYDVIKTIKTAFDPCNIFNPNKIVDPFAMDSSLRYNTNREEPEISTKLSFEKYQGILRLAENCNGSGDCRKSAGNGTMCPSYQATKNEKDSTRGRANVLREVLTNNETVNRFNSEELKKVFDLCISCKACATECPSSVDMAIAKTEFLYQFNKVNKPSKADTFFGKSSSYNKLASRFPALSNFLISNSVTSKLLKNYYHIAPKRSLPKITKSRYRIDTKEIEKNNILNHVVYLFVDEFSKYLDSKLVQDAYFLLNKLGYKVELISNLDSCRALLSKGFLDEAKIEIDKSINELKSIISEETPLIGIEPSAILGFRDEFPKLASDKNEARKIAQHTYLIEEFLASEIKKGNITASSFTSENKEIKIHNHCHQKALSNQKVTFDILNLPKNYKPTIINSGCCGMAGSFGYEKEHYEVSMQIGELRLFPAVRKSSKEILIAANGTSCRHQIKDGTEREALHPITILRNALV